MNTCKSTQSLLLIKTGCLHKVQGQNKTCDSAKELEIHERIPACPTRTYMYFIPHLGKRTEMLSVRKVPEAHCIHQAESQQELHLKAAREV